MLATCKHNPILTELTLFCEKLKALDVSGCLQLSDNDLHQTFKFYQVLPKLNIDKCQAICAELWQCMGYITQQVGSHFPNWNLKMWKQSVLPLLPYASDTVIQMDMEAIESNQVGLVMGLVAFNPNVHTIFMTLSPKNIAAVLTQLLILLQTNHNIAALCITGVLLNIVMVQQVITVIAQCENIHTVALIVDNIQLAIEQFQQVTLQKQQLTQVMVNGVNITSLLLQKEGHIPKNILSIIPVDTSKEEQAMKVDVLALAIMQHDDVLSPLHQSAMNMLELFSASGKLSKHQTTSCSSIIW